jgi:hypothetical protein
MRQRIGTVTLQTCSIRPLNWLCQDTRAVARTASTQTCWDIMLSAPLLSIVHARIDLDLFPPQDFGLCDGAHLLQEEAVAVHDQAVLGHLRQVRR